MYPNFKSYLAKPGEITKNWLVIDATDLVLGRLAAEVASLLRGKHKPQYSPDRDCGDYVVIINAEKVHLTGNKLDRNDGKTYYWHTGYPGGIKSTTSKKVLEGRYPDRVIRSAVRRMMCKNRLNQDLLSNLYIYAGDSHPHAAQKPAQYDFAGKNTKNSKR